MCAFVLETKSNIKYKLHAHTVKKIRKVSFYKGNVSKDQCNVLQQLIFADIGNLSQTVTHKEEIII